MLYLWGTLTFGPLLVVLIRYLSGRVLLENSMLLFGLSVYCFLPFFIYASDSYAGGPGERIWAREFQGLYAAGLVYLLLTGALVAAYLIGRLPAAPPLGRRLNVPISRTSLRRFLLLLLLLWAIFAYLAREWIGQGYSFEYEAGLMGPLATINLATLLALLNIKQWRQSRRLDRGYSLLLLVNSTLLLSMGGRMYVAIPLIALFLQYINAHKRRPAQRARLLLLVIGFIGLLMWIGLSRLGTDFEMELLLLTSLAEPLLTSISLASYATCQSLDIVAFPRNFLGSIINFIPSIILPIKAQLVPELDPSGNCMLSPFGATHLGPALIGNFGIAGALGFAALFAYMLKAVRAVRSEGWWFHFYLCSLLPMMFFRDGFVVFNKAFIGSGLLVILVLIWLDRLRIVPRRARPASPTPSTSA